MKQSLLKWELNKFDISPFLAEESAQPFYVNSMGALFADDCLKVLPKIREGVIDAVFA